MSEHEEEQSSIKVRDRRKFNPDGTIRDGYVEEKPPAVPKTEARPAPETPVGAPEENPDAAVAPEGKTQEIPGADDPASFVNFLSTLATNAAVSLGMMAHPATGKAQADLDGAKYWIDILAMLREKTKGNLHPEESKLLEGLITDFRMQYVELMRAYEAKLKKQASGKIGLNDLLGKRK